MKTNIRMTGKGILLLLIMCLIFLQSCSFIFAPSAEKLYSKAIKKEPYDAVIVPGLPFEGDTWGDLLKARIYWAYHLYSKGVAKNVIFSGSAVYTPYVEAEIMAMYGEALGIPAENIFMEKRAQHSTENLYYSYQLAKDLGFEKIALATDPWQGRFLYFFSKKKHIPVTYIPAQFDSLIDMFKVDPIIDYSKAYVENFVPITEKESFFERLRGTSGKKIVYEEAKEDRRKEEVYLREKHSPSSNN